MDVTIRGITFTDIDMTDAEFLEDYEEGRLEIANLPTPKRGDSAAYMEYIKTANDAARDWLDTLFGDGAGERILPRDSLRDVLIAMKDLNDAMNAANKEIEQIVDSITTPPVDTLPRRERRQAQRQQEKSGKRNRRKRQGSGQTAPQPNGDPYAPERAQR